MFINLCSFYLIQFLIYSYIKNNMNNNRFYKSKIDIIILTVICMAVLDGSLLNLINICLKLQKCLLLPFY